MKQIIFITIGLLLSSHAFAQWEVGAGAGPALPITGYGEVYKSGWLLNGEGKYRFRDGNLAVGMNVQFARLQHDKNPDDQFENARLTVAPVLFFAEYELPLGKIRPYAAAGLGVSLFNVTYDHPDTTSGYAQFNASFTMAPRIGVRYQASQHLFIYAEWNLILIADGPPIYFPHAGQMTGYSGISAGVSYRFSKK